MLTLALLLAQNPKVEATLGNAKEVVIHAERVASYFRLDAMVNGKPVRLIVDSGAGLTVLTRAAAKRLELPAGTPIQAGGVGGGSQAASIVLLDEFRIGDATVRNDSAVVIDLPGELRCDGLVGYSFLRHFATTFDYVNNQLTVRPSGTYDPATDDRVGEMRIWQNHPQVKFKIAGIEGWAVLDSGNNSLGTIFKWFVDKNGLADQWKAAPAKITGKGVGGVVSGREAKHPGFTINGLEFPSGPITLDVSGTGAFADKETIANIGAEYLRRFVFTLDYPAKKAWFRKSADFDSLFVIDRSGVRINDVLGKQMVIHVVEGSPGEEVGVTIGDEVVEIDGIAIADTEPMKFTMPLRRAPGTKVKLKLRKKGVERTVEVTLRDLA